MGLQLEVNVAEADLYKVLGVRREASAEDLKKAYRTLAKKHHPDKNQGNKQAEERFKEAGAAFEVLGDPAKRKLYDELGADAIKINFDPEKAEGVRQWKAAQAGGGGGRGGQRMRFDFGGEGSDFGDLFGSMFGGAARGAPRPAPRAPAEEAPATEVEIDLREAVLGTRREFSLRRMGACPACQGTGMRGGPRGKVCTACQGTGEAETVSTLDVKIPAGVDTGSKVRLPGGPGQGDVYLQVKVRHHPLVHRRGDDLELSLPVTVPEAILGSEVTLPTFEGDVQLRIPPGSQGGRRLRLKEKGVPHLKQGGRGDLYVTLQIVLPESADREVKSAAEQLGKHYAGPVRSGLKL